MTIGRITQPDMGLRERCEEEIVDDCEMR